MDPVPETVPETVPELVSELDRELTVLKAIEGVGRVYELPRGRFDAAKLNNNRVECRVALPDGESYRTVRKKCGGDCPDKVAAARNVKAQVQALLGAAAVEAAEQRVQQSMGSGAAGSSSTGMPVFEFQRERSRLLGVVEAVRLRVAKARQAERKAELEHEEQQRQLTEAQATLEALLEQHPYKRVREEAAAAAASTAAAAEKQRIEAALAADAAAGPPPHPRTKQNPPRDNPPYWARFWSYTRTTYQKEEVEEQDRRAVEVPKEGPADPKQAQLPPGDDTRGWHKHWRRGVFGALQSWAAGDRGAIVYMLAACAVHFGVVDAVGLPSARVAPSCHPSPPRTPSPSPPPYRASLSTS